MKFTKTPPPEYQDPAHVGVLMLLAIIAILGGVFFVATSKMETEPLAMGLGSILGGMYLWIAAAIASNAARAAWSSARLAYELQPVIGEILEQSAQREKAERAATKAREEEIRRAVEARQAKE